MGLRTMTSVLLGTLFFFVPAVQAQVSEAEAHILSAFMTSADPGVFAEAVAVGPQLRKDVGADPEPGELYQAIATLTAGRALRVQFPSPAESARYRTIPGANPTDPFVALETGDMRFIFQYAPKQKRVGFVEQVSGDALPRLAQRKRPPTAKQPAIAAAPPPRPPVVETPIDPRTPRGECVIKPIMSQLDLYNCSAPTAPAAPVDLPPAAVALVKPPVPAGPRKRGECVIKPVMTDEDLFNCVGVTDSTPPVFPVAAAVLHAFIPASPTSLARPECVIKPVMTDEELRRCASELRAAPSSPPAAAPTPVAVQTPEPAAPKPTAECVIKPVMSDEELRICAALAKSTPSLPPVAAVAVPGPAAAAPVPAAAKPPAECIIKPVMSDDDLRACASVPRSGGLLLIPVAASTPAAAAPAPAAPKPAPECVIKPVMSDEELRACGSKR